MVRNPYPESMSGAASRSATVRSSSESSKPLPRRCPMLLVSASTGRLSASSAIAGYLPRASSTQKLARNRLARSAAQLRHRSAPGRRGLMRVALGLAQRDGTNSECPVPPLHRVAGILPALIGQAAAGGVCVLQEPVAVGVAVIGHPG